METLPEHEVTCVDHLLNRNITSPTAPDILGGWGLLLLLLLLLSAGQYVLQQAVHLMDALSHCGVVKRWPVYTCGVCKYITKVLHIETFLICTHKSFTN